MWIDYTTSGQLPQLKELWHTAFGDSREAIDAFFATGYAPERSRCITENGQVLCVLYWLDCWYAGQKMAYIYAVATHPDHRGKGLFRKLSQDTRRLLTEQGYAAELLMPGDEGLRKMYARLGYRTSCFMATREATAAIPPPAAMKPLQTAAYAALRRAYLPSGGAIQDGENLTYLATFARFYAGEDFLLAALREEDSLFGVELLGNTDAIPGILWSLGCKNGTFRTPGKEIPTAMSRPLKENVKMPEYLGFLFD